MQASVERSEAGTRRRTIPEERLEDVEALRFVDDRAFGQPREHEPVDVVH